MRKWSLGRFEFLLLFNFFFLGCFFVQPFLRPASAYVLNTSNSVDGVGIFILDGSGGGTGGKSYYGGATVQIDWRDFEPEEGKYNWGLIWPEWEMVPGTTGTTLPGKFVSWKQYFDKYRTGDASYLVPRDVPGAIIQGLANNGKKTRFKIRTTDGAVPLWLYGGRGGKEVALGMGPSGNGVYPVPVGVTTCKSGYEWEELNCHPDTDVIIEVTAPLYPSKEDNAQPVYWNLIYQEKLNKTLEVMAERMQSNPTILSTIDFVEASVGNFGEMILYGKSETSWSWCSNTTPAPAGCICTQEMVTAGACKQADLGINICTCQYKRTHLPMGIRLWLAAGYTNKKYTKGVLRTLSFYERAFTKLPVALSFGTGLYPSDPLVWWDDGVARELDEEGYPYVVSKYVLPRVMERWGARIYLKFAGFPAGRQINTFQSYCSLQTKCVYETFGPLNQWRLENVNFPFKKEGEADTDAADRFYRGLFGAVNDHVSAIYMWTSDFRTDIGNYPFLEKAVSEVAFLLGPQIAAYNGTNFISFSQTNISAGSSLTITTNWINSSYVSLFDKKRAFNSLTNTYKDIPISYPIYFGLKNNLGQTVFETTYIPNKGTHEWIHANGAADIHTTSDTIFIPWSVPTGTYTPVIGIPLNKELTKFWKIDGLASTANNVYPLSSKSITITSPATAGMSFKKGWNRISWPTVSGLTTEQIQSACPVFTKKVLGPVFVKDYFPAPSTFSSGEEVFFKCQQALW